MSISAYSSRSNHSEATRKVRSVTRVAIRPNRKAERRQREDDRNRHAKSTTTSGIRRSAYRTLPDCRPSRVACDTTSCEEFLVRICLFRGRSKKSGLSGSQVFQDFAPKKQKSSEFSAPPRLTGHGTTIQIHILNSRLDARSPQGGVRLGPPFSQPLDSHIPCCPSEGHATEQGQDARARRYYNHCNLAAEGIVMRRLVRSAKRASVFQRHTGNPRQSTSGLPPYHRRLGVEALEPRRCWAAHLKSSRRWSSATASPTRAMLPANLLHKMVSCRTMAASRRALPRHSKLGRGRLRLG